MYSYKMCTHSQENMYNNELSAVYHHLTYMVLLLIPQRKKATIHQLNTMLATSKNVLFPGHNHLVDSVFLPSVPFLKVHHNTHPQHRTISTKQSNARFLMLI